jgi:purine nucleoside permease
LFSALLLAALTLNASAAAPRPVKVMIISMFGAEERCGPAP